eukprot:766428-Hanusia_phi.AAC.1
MASPFRKMKEEEEEALLLQGKKTWHNMYGAEDFLKSSRSQHPLTDVSFMQDAKSAATNEMHALRSIQSARAVVASERQKLLSKSSMLADKTDWSGSPSIQDPMRKASEEQLFQEVGLLMQERDLLQREKSTLQAILASSAEEIKRLFDSEQKHVNEMKHWLLQKESLEHDCDAAVQRMQEYQRQAESLAKQLDHCKTEKLSVEKSEIKLRKDCEEFQKRVKELEEEISSNATIEKNLKNEKMELMREKMSLEELVVSLQAEIKHQHELVEQLQSDAIFHRRAADQWQEERKTLLEDRAERDRLQVQNEELQSARRSWSDLREQLIKDKSDCNAQLQMSLQQLNHQQKTIDANEVERSQLCKQIDNQNREISALEGKLNALDKEVNMLRNENTNLNISKQDIADQLNRSERENDDLTRNFDSLRGDFERVQSQKMRLCDEMDSMQRELEARKLEVKDYEAKVSELHKQVYRLQEYESFYMKEQDEKKKVESAYFSIPAVRS